MPFFVNQPGSVVPTLWILFVLFALCYLVISAVLLFHWSRYGLGSRTIAGARILFLAVSAAIFVTAGVLLGAL